MNIHYLKSKYIVIENVTIELFLDYYVDPLVQIGDKTIGLPFEDKTKALAYYTQLTNQITEGQSVIEIHPDIDYAEGEHAIRIRIQKAEGIEESLVHPEYFFMVDIEQPEKMTMAYVIDNQGARWSFKDMKAYIEILRLEGDQ